MSRALRPWLFCLLVLALPLKGLAAAGWMLGCAAGHGLPVAAAEAGHGHGHHGHHGHHDHAEHHPADADADADDGASAVDCSHCAPCSMVAAPSAAAITLPALPSGGMAHALADGRRASADTDVPLRPPRPDLA